MENFDFKLPEIRCQTSDDVITALQRNPQIRKRMEDLISAFNHNRDRTAHVSLEDLISMFEKGEYSRSRPEDIRHFYFFVMTNVRLMHGENVQSLKDESIHSVVALKAIEESKKQELNRLIRTVLGMMHTLLTNTQQRINIMLNPQKEMPTPKSTVGELPSVDELLSGCDARDLAQWVYALPNDKRHHLLRQLLDAAKPTGQPASKVMGPWLGGLQIILTDSLTEWSAEREQALVLYIRYLQKHHPKIAQLPSSTETQGSIEAEVTKGSYGWLTSIPAANLGHHFYENVSLAERRRIFNGVIQHLQSQISDGTLQKNRNLEPLRTVQARNEQVLIRAFQEVKRLLEATKKE